MYVKRTSSAGSFFVQYEEIPKEFLVLHKNSLRSKDAHSREVEDVARRPRSARECARAHSFLE